MKEFKDDEMDFGGGGDTDLSGGETETRMTTKEKKWSKAFGLTSEEVKKIDKSSDAHKSWKVLDPTRQ